MFPSTCLNSRRRNSTIAAPIMIRPRPRAASGTSTRRDVEQGGQDQADGAQDLDCSEGLDEAGAEIQDPSPARCLGQFLLRDEQLAGAGGQEDSGHESGNDPQGDVHEVSPCSAGRYRTRIVQPMNGSSSAQWSMRFSRQRGTETSQGCCRCSTRTNSIMAPGRTV